MIPFKTYCGLEEALQIQLLWLEGVFLMVRHTSSLDVELYSLSGFYVEIFYDRPSREPVYLKPFRSTDQLDPYLETISLEGIFGFTKEQ